MLIAINFHYVRPAFEDPFPSIYGVTPKQLQRQLETLGSVGQFVSAETVRDAAVGQGTLPERAILITFDDGLREQYEHAKPVLDSIGAPAVFFVNTAPIANRKVSHVHKVHLLRARVAPVEFISILRRQANRLEVNLNLSLNGATRSALSQYPYDTVETAQLKYAINVLLPASERNLLIDACFEERFASQEEEIASQLYMDLDHVRDIGTMGYLGSHGHEHVPLAQLPTEEASEQIRLSLSYLEGWSGQRVFALSYPYGSREACSEKIGKIAAALGVTFALTMERAGNRDLSQPHLLARFDSNDLPGGSSPKFKLDKLFDTVPVAADHSGRLTQ